MLVACTRFLQYLYSSCGGFQTPLHNTFLTWANERRKETHAFFIFFFVFSRYDHHPVVHLKTKHQNPIPRASLPCLISLPGYNPMSFCLCSFFINHSSYADQKKTFLSFPFSCHYHHKSDLCVAMGTQGTQGTQAPHYCSTS